MTVGRQQAPAAFGSPRSGERAPAPQAFGAAGSSERRMAPPAFGSSRSGAAPRQEAPAAFTGATRTWKQDGAPSAFGGGGGRREAPAAFGGGAAGEDRRKRLEEKAAEARYRAELAVEERRKAAEAAAIAKKAMDMNDEESYPTLGAAPAKKKPAASSGVSLVIDGSLSGTATAAAAAASAPKSMWGSASSKPAPAPSTNSWTALAEPEVKPLSMAQRIAAASARVDEEEAVRQAMEHRDRALNRPCFDHYTEHQRRLASLPRRTLDDGFDDDPAYRCDLDEDDGYYAGQPAEEEDEDGEFNAGLVSDRRRGDKGVW